MQLAICIIVSFGIGLQIGISYRELRDMLTTLIKREPEQESTVVTALPPDYADVNRSSAIVTPKTPAEIDFQEQERVRNL